jgi:uncharacterized protein (TIGR02599 family)
MEPSEKLSIYKYTSGNSTYSGLTWFQDPLGRTNRSSRVLAENIIALVFLPKDPSNSALTTDFQYDTAPDGSASTQPFSEHQLPPYIQVTMVAIDEASAARLAAAYGTTMPDPIQPQWFTDPSKYEEDLGWLRRQLGGEFDPKQRVNYRIFTASVPIHGAKWSRN